MYAKQLDDDLYPMTEEEYLAFADKQELKYEYSNGYVYAMTGGTVNHGVITVNISTHLNILLREQDCSVTSPDVRVFIAYKQSYRYPDVTVFCGDRIYREGRTDTLMNPVLLVEVLSPSTESKDRKQKLDEYTRIDTLQAYVLVEQDEPNVSVYQRHPSGQWLYNAAIGLESELTISFLDTELCLSLAEIYRRITWEEPEAEEEADDVPTTEADEDTPS